MAKPKPREAINTRLVDATKEYCYILSLVIIIFLIFLWAKRKEKKKLYKTIKYVVIEMVFGYLKIHKFKNSNPKWLLKNVKVEKGILYI